MSFDKTWIPIYVTRADGRGEQGIIREPVWLIRSVRLLFLTALVLWLLIALVAGVEWFV